MEKLSKGFKNSDRKLREYLQSLDKDKLIGLFLHIKWEKDIALEQLEELGYGLGEMINTENKETEQIESINYSFDIDNNGNFVIKNPEKSYEE